MRREFAFVRVIVCSVIVASCGDAEADNDFAESFIRHLHAGHEKGQAQIDPESDLATIGWVSLHQGARAHLPSGQIDSIVNQEWGVLRDEFGTARKAVYRLYSDTVFSVVELWVVGEPPNQRVNTVRVTGPVNAAHDKK